MLSFLSSLLRGVCSLLLAVLTVLTFPLTGLINTGTLTTAGLDCVPDQHYTDAADIPCDPDATPETRALLRYLKAQYGSYILSGQYIDCYEDYTQAKFLDGQGDLDVRLANELAAVTAVTGGKYPAVLGLDYTGVEYGGPEWQDWTTQQAIQWHELGGVVTICWHWTVPQDVNSDPAAWSRWQSSIYAEETNFSLSRALAHPDGAEYQWLLRGIERLAAELQRLQDTGVPVLWRPLHEAAGGWFWWGAAGKDAYLALYNLLFDQLVTKYGLHNLIWVWNAQDPRWYVGGNRADILSDDPYVLGDINWLYQLDPARADRFKRIRRTDPGKMVAMSENDYVGPADAFWRKNTKWLFFCTWMRERTLLPDPANPPYGMSRNYNETYMRAADLRALYEDPRVLTLDDISIPAAP
ncbi:MAG: glycoside hydrolase family 26 protein [Oscillospiraceae bacterium]|jgi:mannan endo-1,4-beta-mannosidase|nr:glycoside hydrolase family 26 protein [Oscillospiraceae bacterium]